MPKRIKSVIKTRFRKTNFNSFIFFLLFAVVIWIFVQFSKQYNEIINVPVNYINVPPDKLLSPENPKFLKLRMEENGFRIAWFSLFPPTLDLDVSEAVVQGNQLIYVIDDHRGEITSQMNINFGNNQFVKDAILIDFQQKKEKTVPVKSRINIEFAAGYSAIKGLELEPDSVVVTGPDNILDTLTRLYTEQVDLSKVKENVSGTVGIDTSAFENLTLYHQDFRYSIDVGKFTEGNVMVPIELINVPEALNVVIFPKETLLFFQVNLKDYNKVTASDFRVVADFKDVRENQDFLLLQVVQKPEFTNNIRINEKRIQFIIKK